MFLDVSGSRRLLTCTRVCIEPLSTFKYFLQGSEQPRLLSTQGLFAWTMRTEGFPGSSVVKYLPANAGGAGDSSSIPGSGRSPGGGHGNPLQYSCLENPHGQRSLDGYSPRGHKESDTTEQLALLS